MEGWNEVLRRILEKEPLEKELGGVEYVRGYRYYAKSLESLDLRKSEPLLTDVKTDTLATYHPSSSPPTIVYYIDKIVYHSDMILSRTISNIGRRITLELIKLFRLCFASFVRRHEIFHYLVERGARLAHLNYHDYIEKVYNVRDQSSQGNLEEALADAYASVRYYWLEEIYYVYYFSDIIYEDIFLIEPKLFDNFTKILKYHIINSKRPPGYDKAKLFVDEFEHLLLRYDRYIPYRHFYFYPPLLPFYLRRGIFIYGYPICIFKGLSWLFDELREIEPRNFSDYTNPPSKIHDEYELANFILFLENIRYDDDPLLERTILPFPREIPK